MNNELFTSLVNLIVLAMGIALTYFIIPYLKTKLGAAKYNNLLMWASKAVAAAEQIYNEDGQGEKKKEYVLEFLKSKGVTLTDKELEVLIEAAVLELKKAVK